MRLNPLFLTVAFLFLLPPLASAGEIHREKPGTIEGIVGLVSIQALLNETGGETTDPSYSRYVDPIFHRITQSSLRPGAMKLMVLDSMEVNALAIPGGVFAVTRGLLHYVRNDDELACALGHELGHHEFAHGLASVKSRFGFALGLAALGIVLGEPTTREEELQRQAIEKGAEIIAFLYAMKFSRQNELEADLLAVAHTSDAGYNPNACIDLMQRFQADTDRLSAIQVLASSHPPFDQRTEGMARGIRLINYQGPTFRRTSTRDDLPRLRGGPFEGAAPQTLDKAAAERVHQAVKAARSFEAEAEGLDEAGMLDLLNKRLGGR